jgi:hypothetical protein
MRSFICVAAALLLLSLIGMAPYESHDASELAPVQTLLVKLGEDGYTLTADNGASGSGESWAAAVEDLRKSCDGVAFLQTAQKVVLSGNVAQAMREVAQTGDLRPAAELFLTDTEQAADALQSFLKSRTSAVTLGRLRAALTSGQSLSLPVVEADGEKVRLKDG